jgi:hypothetical protein
MIPAHRLSTLDTTPQKPAHSEYGVGGQRQLTIKFSPSSVTLEVKSETVQLQAETWEYAFIDDGVLELRFMSPEPIVGYVRPLGANTITALTGLDGVLQFSCPRPSSDDLDEQYEFVFTRDTTSGSTALPRTRPRPTLPSHASGKPGGPHASGDPTDIEATSAQPTLIIRTKRSSPTGVTKPSWDITI